MMEVEYWEVNENSVKDIMNIFLGLFVPESKVLSKNKPIKWCVIKEKALPVMTARFDSKVEEAIQRKIQVEDQLAELLENKDTPANVLQDADYDTSDGENDIETTRIH
jgi:ATP sulfurylase